MAFSIRSCACAALLLVVLLADNACAESTRGTATSHAWQQHRRPLGRTPLPLPPVAEGSQLESWTLSPGGAQAQRLLYVTRHRGTLADFKAVCNGLGCHWTAMNPVWGSATAAKPGMSATGADEVWNKLYRALCHYDVFVVCDTIVDARPLLQHGVCGGKPLILQVTNRFDWKVSDPQAYLDLMRNATNMTNVFWVPNNPYELHYMQQKGVVPPPERTRVIRPLGYSHLGGLPLDISAANKTATGLKLAVVAAHNNLALLIPHLEKAGIPYNGLIKRRYGGPLTLGRYDLVLDVPYQCSVMAFPENLAAGVVHLVPSAKFLVRLLNAKDGLSQHHYACFGPAQRALSFEDQVANIKAISEYHHPFFADYMLYFDSWDHLTSMILDGNLGDKIKQKRTKVKQQFVYANRTDIRTSQHGRDVLAAWQEVLQAQVHLRLPADTAGCGPECSRLGSSTSSEFLERYWDAQWSS